MKKFFKSLGKWFVRLIGFMLFMAGLSVLVNLYILKPGDALPSGETIGAYTARVVLAMLIGVFILYKSFKPEIIQRRNGVFKQREGYSDIENILANRTAGIISVGGLKLRTNERVLFKYPGSLLKASIKNVGSESVGNGGSVYLGAGISYHIGENKRVYTRGRVEDLYPGIFVITSNRLLFLNPDKGFEKAVKDITSINLYNKVGVSIICSGRVTTIVFEHEKIAKAAIIMLRKAISEVDNVKNRIVDNCNLLEPNQVKSGKNVVTAIADDNSVELYDSDIVNKIYIDDPRKKTVNGIDPNLFKEVSLFVVRMENFDLDTIKEYFDIPDGAALKLTRTMESLGIIRLNDDRKYTAIVTIYELNKILNNNEIDSF